MKRLIVLLLLCASAAASAKGAVSDGAVETGNGSGRGRYCV